VIEVIDKIEEIRGRNNKNWMDLLRLAIRVAPEEAKVIIGEIYKHDDEISRLVKQLLGGKDD